jgi:hypothetical protein
MSRLKRFIKRHVPLKYIKGFNSFLDICLPRNWGRHQTIRLDRLLFGGEFGVTGIHWAKYTNDLLRTSKRVTEIPHYILLSDYMENGPEIFNDPKFFNHPYFLNALGVLNSGHNYHGARTAEEVKGVAKKFVNEQEELSKNTQPIRVRKVKGTDFYQIVDGHHRSAIFAMTGMTRIRCKVDYFNFEKTAIQELLEFTFWNTSEKVLYQPLPVPEASQMTLVRKCDDRFDKMAKFLESKQILNPGGTNTFLDIGSYFGYFPSAFKKLGLRVFALERDPFACKIAETVYGLNDEEIINLDLDTFLNTSTSQFDVVSCLSVLHHFLNDRENGNADKFLNLISKKTRHFLFLEMGTEAESWFSESLQGWDQEKVIEWVFKNTDFDSVNLLGEDSDGVNKFFGNFGRQLMVFSRKQ